MLDDARAESRSKDDAGASPSASGPSKADHAGGIAPEPMPRVLIVEDDLRLRKVLMMVAESFCVPVGAATAEEAMVPLERESFDVIIADLMLGPGESGVWLLREAAKRNPAMRRCLISGTVPYEHGAAHAFFLKPIRVEDLRLAVLGTEATTRAE